MECFHTAKLLAPQVLTANANQIIVPGYFPKATAGDERVFHGMQAGSTWDKELSRWMACRDLINHPNPVMREQQIKAGTNEFARLAQGCDKTEGMDVVSFIARHQVPTARQSRMHDMLLTTIQRKMSHEDCKLHVGETN